MTTIAIHPYRPGAIGETVRHHATYYLEHWEFDSRFETQVARELSEFIRQFDPLRDGFWWAARGEKFAGAVAVDGTRGEGGLPRIRWFIVPEIFQGDGVGAMLFDQAVRFCRDGGCKSVYLWTFAGLVAARKLYERNGFQLVEERQGTPWGPVITEQKFELILGSF
ncbi:MAG: GNAT family N-acetyltransferase [Pseudodesulfovibrio sp.]|nr:GNAT family N-acetyltransferase [Pseudodesulfovibrio sp.]